MKIKVKQDYAAKRRDAYPPTHEQLEALTEGGEKLEQMLERIAEVKRRYPKKLAEGAKSGHE